MFFRLLRIGTHSAGAGAVNLQATARQKAEEICTANQQQPIGGIRLCATWLEASYGGFAAGGESLHAETGWLMLDSRAIPTADLLLLTVPSFCVMILSLFRLDERTAKPRSRSRQLSRFCEIDANGQPIVSDPGGAAHSNVAGRGKAIGQRRGFCSVDDEEP